MKKECENADCLECERCKDESDDPVGCISKEEIKFGATVFVIILIVLLILVL